MTATEPGDPRDFEAITEARQEAFTDAWLWRMDRTYGRVEDWRPDQERPR